MTPVVEAPEAPYRRNPFVVGALAIAIGFIIFMWIYAFFFASKVGINRIDDRAWSKQAELTCTAANEQLAALADYRRIDKVGPDALRERAEIVAKTNVILDDMLTTLGSTTPTDAKGQKIVPLWLADWRTYLNDRVTYVASLRSGSEALFSETEIKGSPISNFIGDVARQNEMPACQVPLDLAN